MAKCILSHLFSHLLSRLLSLLFFIPQLTVDQWWALFVLIASEIALVYFGRQVWLRCD